MINSKAGLENPAIKFIILGMLGYFIYGLVSRKKIRWGWTYQYAQISRRSLWVSVITFSLLLIYGWLTFDSYIYKFSVIVAVCLFALSAILDYVRRKG